MNKITPVLAILLFILMSPLVKSTDITNCTSIGSSGNYTLINDIDAYNPSQSETCIFINANNVLLDLNDRTITNYNNTEYGVYRGILINAKSNITIKSGTLTNFTFGTTGSALVVNCLYTGCSNITTFNLKLINNILGVVIQNATNSNFQFAIDQPLYDTGGTIEYVNNSVFNVFARSKTYGLVITNLTNSKVTGHFDTNIIVQQNTTTTAGNFLSFITGGLIPPTVLGTTVTQTQSKGIGLMVWSSNNNIFQDISSYGLIQGIALENSNNNTLAIFDLPLSGKYTGGRFGGVWLGVTSFNNTLCQISGVITDDCPSSLLNRLSLSYQSGCDYKNNLLYTSCNYILNITQPTAQTMQQLYLMPLIPSATIPQYPFVTFMTTPFFLALFFSCAGSVFVAMKTNTRFGIYLLMILVFLSSMVTFTTFWFGLVFEIIMGYILMKTKEESVQNEQ